MELGSTVTLTYVGTLASGEEFGHATKEKPMKFQTGMDMAIDGFEEYKAYGEYLDDFVQRVPLEQVPRGNVKVGQRVWMSSSENGVPMPVTVTAIEDGCAVFDMNHPLAGQDLTFEVEILEIEAAPENFVSAAEKARHMKEQQKLLGGDQGDDFR